MEEDYADPEKVAKAKALASGPYGNLTSKFPMLYAKAGFFGSRPSRDKPAVSVSNGTTTLLHLDAGPMAVTCDHVIRGFEKAREKDRTVIFQIGHVELDPLVQLIDRNPRRDIATISLTKEQAETIKREGEIGSCFYQPWDWPPPLPKTDEWICFGGFPGALRNVLSFDELEFGSWSSAGSQVSASSEFQVTTAFERDYWISSFGKPQGLDLTALGGLSGGPVLIKRRIAFEMVGIIRAHSEAYDAMFATPLRCLRRDGTIEPLPFVAGITSESRPEAESG